MDFTNLLSKSDFKLASSCTKKLVYRKQGYLTTQDSNEFLESLAQGGHIVGKYAQLTYAEGVEVKEASLEEALKATFDFLEANENITLFEATFAAQGKVIRTDILEKKGNVLHIIEVKSKSHDSEDDSAKAKTKLEIYIEDLAFQTFVLSEACPGYEIKSSLLMPDKSKRTSIDGLSGWFNISIGESDVFESDELPVHNSTKFKKPIVSFKYENASNREIYVKQIIDDNLLTLYPSDESITGILNEIRNRTNTYIEILQNGIKPDHYKLNKECKKCEFNLKSEVQKNGFRECWGEMTDIDPHIFDLYYGGGIGGSKAGYYLDQLIAQKTVSFWDLDPERFKDAKGNYGPRGERQLLQYQKTKSGIEHLDEALKLALDQMEYPLHFIDFETYTGAIPHHKGMRPYEKIAFQWSCHTLNSPDGDLVHVEFLNDEYSFPNFRFAESLMEHIGDTGTPLMWSDFENTTLKQILAQMDTHSYANESLKTWLTNITSNSKPYRLGRFVDMASLTLKYYFHPEMKGKFSIKKVLPAVWKNNEYIRNDPWFKEYVLDYELNLNPYDSLMGMISELEKEDIVKDGTGAMRAYNDIMFGPVSKDFEKRELVKKSMLNYCKLDTMSMVIIWKYWNHRLSASNAN